MAPVFFNDTATTAQGGPGEEEVPRRHRHRGGKLGHEKPRGGAPGHAPAWLLPHPDPHPAFRVQEGAHQGAVRLHLHHQAHEALGGGHGHPGAEAVLAPQAEDQPAVEAGGVLGHHGGHGHHPGGLARLHLQGPGEPGHLQPEPGVFRGEAGHLLLEPLVLRQEVLPRGEGAPGGPEVLAQAVAEVEGKRGEGGEGEGEARGQGAGEGGEGEAQGEEEGEEEAGEEVLPHGLNPRAQRRAKTRETGRPTTV